MKNTLYAGMYSGNAVDQKTLMLNLSQNRFFKLQYSTKKKKRVYLQDTSLHPWVEMLEE